MADNQEVFHWSITWFVVFRHSQTTWFDVLRHSQITWFDVLRHSQITWFDVLRHSQITWFDVLRHSQITWFDVLRHILCSHCGTVLAFRSRERFSPAFTLHRSISVTIFKKTCLLLLLPSNIACVVSSLHKSVSKSLQPSNSP